jgi:DNA-binding SARP family transcriptional activator/DNA-binding beta-propeller fold protein YncE
MLRAVKPGVLRRRTTRNHAQQWPQVEFRILGPLEASKAGEPLSLGGRKQRAVLALLLLNANYVVPRERLIDEVWEQDPPAGAEGSLRVYVARLRKLLAAGNGSGSILETHANGYALRIDPDALDLNRFKRLVATAEQARAEGRLAEAAEELAEALGLWRGPALGDLASEEWARGEAAALDDLRLGALEERVDADLALGRHAELVSELETLVAVHPHRERLVGQLMLALYRAGRQPEALQAYAAASNALREEFGLEPTRALRELERRILLQDPELDVAVPKAARASPLRRRRLVGASFAATVLGASIVGAWLLTGSDERTASRAVALRGNSVVAIDPTNGSLLGEVRIGGRPSGIAVGARSVWVGNRDDETLLRIDPRRRTVVRTIGLGHVPGAITVGGGSVWVASESGHAVLQVDPDTNDVVATIPLRGTADLCCSVQVVFARGAAWVSYWRLLARIEPGTGRAVVTRARDIVAIASNGQSLWAVRGVEADLVQRLEPRGDPLRIGAFGPSANPGSGGLAVGDQAVWIASLEGALARIDPDTSRITASLPLGRNVSGVALGERALWVVGRDGVVLRMDPTNGRLLNASPLGVYPPYLVDTVATGEGAVWVTALER